MRWAFSGACTAMRHREVLCHVRRLSRNVRCCDWQKRSVPTCKRCGRHCRCCCCYLVRLRTENHKNAVVCEEMEKHQAYRYAPFSPCLKVLQVLMGACIDILIAGNAVRKGTKTTKQEDIQYRTGPGYSYTYSTACK